VAKKNQPAIKPTVSTSPTAATIIAKAIPHKYAAIFLFLFTCMIYSNTLWNRYAIDDVIVVTDNSYTKKGFGGLKDHFTHDMFEGFFGERGAKLVSGGRYRPLSMATFAVEYEIMRKIRGDKREVIDEKNLILTEVDPYLNPVLSHAINVLLFALTIVLLYFVLVQIIPAKFTLATPIGAVSLSLIASILYAAHPLHTEAVANIKGRDEVMCMLFSLLALYASIRYVKTEDIKHIVWGTVIFFIALLSKENAITFLAVVPLVYYFFTKAQTKHYAIAVGLFTSVTAIFLLLRGAYTQSGLTQDSPEILNNPFLLATPAERYATAIYTFLRYYWLMIFPHPLTHDYYYNQIAYVNFSDGKFLLSFFATVGLVAYALLQLKKKSIAAFGILFFFITFSVASNILFTVGVLMNERFIYMSSLGFCILLAALFFKAQDKWKVSPNVLTGVLVVIIGLYSAQTFARNFDWKDSFKLFRVDAKHSANSAKIQTSLGGDLAKAALSNISAFRDSGEIIHIFKDLSHGSKSTEELNSLNLLPDSTLRNMLLDSSIAHLNEAIRIYPTHSNAWLLMGNSMYQRYNDAQQVIPVYEKASAYRVGGYYDAYFNLGVVYNNTNQALKAKENLLKAHEMKPEVYECRFLLAQSYAKLNQLDSCNYWLKRVEEIKPLSEGDYYLIGTAFGKVANNLPMAIEFLKIAVQKNPKVELYLEDLGVAYGFNKQYDEAIATSNQLIALNPNYPAAYMNLSVSSRMKGNITAADEYLKKYNDLISSRK
jgi:tetratricopeptide (TPR) repeat protein